MPFIPGTQDLLAKNIFGGLLSTCALLYDESLKCWGSNENGQLGQGTSIVSIGSAPGSMGDALPAINFGAGYSVKTVCYAWGSHRCAILSNGGVKCWGSNSAGKLGLGRAITSALGDGAGEMGDSLPFVNLGTDSTQPGNPPYKVLDVTCGNSHTCALLENKQVKCWGLGSKLGYESTTSRGSTAASMGNSLPFVSLGTGLNVTILQSGFEHTCVKLSNSGMKCWGGESNGRLGYGVYSTGNRGSTANSMGNNLPLVDLGNSRTVKQLSLGHTHSCAILDNDSLKCWGAFMGIGSENQYDLGGGAGEMGDALNPVNLGTGAVPVQVYAGDRFTCAKLQNNQVKCWGLCIPSIYPCDDQAPMYPGEGPDTMGDNLNPIVFEGSMGSAKYMTLGNEFVCGLLQSNYVRCWGSDNQGSLGDELDLVYVYKPQTTATIRLGTSQCSSSSASVVCKQCPTPTFWTSSSSSCTACRVGTQYVDPSLSCTTCPSGFQSVADYYGDGSYPESSCSVQTGGATASPTPTTTPAATPSPTPESTQLKGVKTCTTTSSSSLCT